MVTCHGPSHLCPLPTPPTSSELSSGVPVCVGFAPIACAHGWPPWVLAMGTKAHDSALPGGFSLTACCSARASPGGTTSAAGSCPSWCRREGLAGNARAHARARASVPSGRAVPCSLLPSVFSWADSLLVTGWAVLLGTPQPSLCGCCLLTLARHPGGWVRWCPRCRFNAVCTFYSRTGHQPVLHHGDPRGPCLQQPSLPLQRF